MNVTKTKQSHNLSNVVNKALQKASIRYKGNNDLIFVFSYYMQKINFSEVFLV